MILLKIGRNRHLDILSIRKFTSGSHSAITTTATNNSITATTYIKATTTIFTSTCNMLEILRIIPDILIYVFGWHWFTCDSHDVRSRLYLRTVTIQSLISLLFKLTL